MSNTEKRQFKDIHFIGNDIARWVDIHAPLVVLDIRVLCGEKRKVAVELRSGVSSFAAGWARLTMVMLEVVAEVVAIMGKGEGRVFD